MPTSGTFTRVDRPTILFADADSNTRFAYQSMATAAGFAVELASDGYEAAALANLVRPDVVILDPLLAGYDGFEVIRQLRANERTSQIPILVVSSNDGSLFEESVRASGCNARLVKPCSANVLLRLIAVLMIRSRADSKEKDSSTAASCTPMRAFGRAL